VDGFVVERKSNPSGTYQEIARVGPSVRQYIDGPSAGIPYSYRVASYRGAYDVSDYSATTAQLPLPTDGVASASYDVSSNRLTGANYEYDAAGNATRVPKDDGTWVRLQYDAESRLVAVMDDGFHPLETYTYGADRRRMVTQYASGDKTYFVWNGGSVLAEYEWTQGAPTPRWKRSYVHMGSRLLSTRTRRTADAGDVEWTEYHHSDRLGTRLITHAGAAEVHFQQTLPFGTALQVAGSAQTSNRLFTSYDRSQTTGLDYAVNRYYSSALGRFLQADPVGLAGASIATPQSFNLYAYGGNDPVNKTDPTGLDYRILLDGVDYYTNGSLWLPGDLPLRSPPDLSQYFRDQRPSSGPGPVGILMREADRAELAAKSKRFSDIISGKDGPVVAFAPAIGIGILVGGEALTEWLIAAGLIGGTVVLAKAAADAQSKAVPDAIADTKTDEERVEFHHPWPMYLGGPANQLLEPLPRSLHIEYHVGLDEIARRYLGTGYFASLAPQSLFYLYGEVALYTQVFDEFHGTHLYQAMIREGFPQ
jgi:RHS repeat-associated protein